ncbi:hypothetical protein [Streptomyces sp. NPDC059489]|uniref:hypothetical protein n=1 Tax=Streptomyces sp. NPDC059489 TaxID=3346849 RepID=UPI0036D136DE
MTNSENAPDVTDVAAQALSEAFFLFTETQPGGHFRRGVSGTSELITTTPVPFPNGVIGTAREADAEEIAAAVLSDAYRNGARTAFLHASPMGVPLYRAMGFRLAESWTVFVP